MQLNRPPENRFPSVRTASCGTAPCRRALRSAAGVFPKLVICIAVSIFVPHSIRAQEPEALLRSVSLFGGLDRFTCGLTMTIRTPQGQKERGLELFYERSGTETDILVQIVSPSFLRNMKFLQHHTDRENARWLKTSTGVRRLASSGDDEPLFGSDFTTEDVSDFPFEVYRLERLPDSRTDGVECTVIRCVPVKAGGAFTEKRYFIEKETSVIRRIEWLSAGGAVVKQYRVLELRTVSGSPFPWEAIVEDAVKSSSTVLSVRSLDPDARIPARVFSRGNL